MRVAQISYHTCPLAQQEGKQTGGMNVYVYNLSLELAKRGVTVDVFTRSEDARAKKIVEVTPGFRVIHLKAGPEKSLPKLELIKYIPEFSRNLQKFINVGARHGVPLQHELLKPYDIIHAHYYMSGEAIRKLFKEEVGCPACGQAGCPVPMKIPTVISFHTLALLKNLVARNGEMEPQARVDMEMNLVRDFDRIISPSRIEKKYLRFLYAAKPNKIEIIPPGYDAKIFHPADKTAARRKIGACPDHKIILFVGRIEPLKGIDVLLYALKILVEKCQEKCPCLWIVGGENNFKFSISNFKSNSKSQNSKQNNPYNPFRENPSESKSQLAERLHESSVLNKTRRIRVNPELQKLYQLQKQLGLDSSIKFVGQKSQNELADYYNAADVVVMPSHYESFGMSALEAMACGTPVVTTNVTGISATFGESGRHMVISVNNPLELAETIEKIFSVGTRHNVPKGSPWRTSTINDFTWAKMAERMEEMYQQIDTNS